MTRYLSMLILSISMIYCEDSASIFQKSLDRGLKCIADGNIPDAMNYIRRGINCYWLQGIPSNDGNKERIERMIAGTEDNTRKAALMVYLAVNELTKQTADLNHIEGILTKALKYDAKLPEIHNTRGVVRHSKGDDLGAIDDYSNAIELNPNYVDAIKNRMDSLIKLGNRADALKDMVKYQELLNQLYYKK